MTVTFRKNSDDLRLMAVYVAQLIKEGVAFEMKTLDDRTEVTLTGGF